MTKISRLIILVLSFSMISVYFLPIWEINLDAPQYPEGLDMSININSMGGDIASINGLNHYIGMKLIEPDSIPELKILPYILALIILTGLIVTFVGKKSFLFAWVIFLIILGSVGGIDFYMWEYDYGHNLNPHAAIIIEGMNYQPPLWGTKKLLNFTAYSYPDTGGYIVIFSGLIASFLLGYELFLHKIKLPILAKEKSKDVILAMGCFILLISSCSKPQPIPLKYGKDTCDFCKMTLMDRKYGAELITQKGKIYKFDSIECLAQFILEGTVDSNQIFATYNIDFKNPGTLMNSQNSIYLHCEDLPSPMGLYLTSFSNTETKSILSQYSGKLLSWNEIMEISKNTP